MKTKTSSRLVLIVISALFISPLVLAWLMYTGTIGFKPGSVQNYGELVQPPVPVDWQNIVSSLPTGNGLNNPDNAASFSGFWIVLHVMPADCLSPCQEAIYGLRQVHRASGRDQHRIRIALLLAGAGPFESTAKLRDIYPKFQLLEGSGGDIPPVFEAIADKFSSASTGSSFLIDPMGNIMMFYAAGFDPNDLKKDLKRLLKWSK
jgi:hypothetical protein